MYQRNRTRVDPNKCIITNIINPDFITNQLLSLVPDELRYTLPIYMEKYNLRELYRGCMSDDLYNRVPKEIFDMISYYTYEAEADFIQHILKSVSFKSEFRIVTTPIKLLRTLNSLIRQVNSKSTIPPMISYNLLDIESIHYIRILVNRQTLINYEAAKKIEDNELFLT